MGKMIDITNQRFGKLVAIKPIGVDNRGEKKWLCKCDCGKEITALSSNLRKGRTQSCGCSKLNNPNFGLSYHNLIGQRFGKLTVIEKTSERLNNQVIWLCQCDCGNLTKVRSYNLVSGQTYSCGCLKQSHGEYQIEKILKFNNIQYTKEQVFDTCIFPDTQQHARFDFYIENNYIIEFDGEQHFTYNERFSYENFKKIKEHDLFKNNWCKENHIPIIRIPYTHLNNICLNDLQPQTSLFLLKE